MSFDSVVPKPVYTMVDLNKKRKDRVKAKYRVQKSSSPPSPGEQAQRNINDERAGESATADTSEGSGDGGVKAESPPHSYEDIETDPAPLEMSHTTTNVAKSSYTLISKDTLLPPEGTRYEDTAISSNKETRKKEKGMQRFCCVTMLLVVLLVAAISAGFTFVLIEIFELKSELNSVQTLSRTHSPMQSVVEHNQSMQSIAHLEDNLNYLSRNLSTLKFDLSLLRSNLLSNLSILKSDLRSNLSMISEQYCSKTNCTAIQMVVDGNSNSLHQLVQQHQQLVDTLDHLGQPSSPAASCAALLAFSPSTPSGYYWVRASNGSAVRVYCDMTRSCGGVTGGWVRVASLDTTVNDTHCPGDLRPRNDSNITVCGIRLSTFSTDSLCSSATFGVDGVLYSRVCGRVEAFQFGSPDAFHPGQNLDGVYLDGVSLTHGSPQKQHIWSWAAASNSSTPNCPCTTGTASSLPPLPFVGQDYFCDTASQDGSSQHTHPLWDGVGCVPTNSCCSFNDPPWFYKQLPQPTTDDVEIRICADQDRFDEDIGIESFEIYVQ